MTRDLTDPIVFFFFQPVFGAHITPFSYLLDSLSYPPSIRPRSLPRDLVYFSFRFFMAALAQNKTA